jgi:hypothetical protein
MAKLSFKKCDCGGPLPHGHFDHEEAGEDPFPTFSVEIGEDIIKKMEERGVISSQEAEAARAELRGAGLSENMTLPDLLVSIAV